jgi:YbbR domain-containing protein
VNPLKSAGSNFGLKLLALLCSIMLWAYVQRQEPATVPITTRLEVRGLSDDLVATTALSQVTVIASGPRVYTNRIDPNAIRAYLDLHNRSNGQYRLDVKVEASETIRALVSVAPAPEKVDVRIQQKTKRDVPVQVEWQGEAPPGQSYGSPRLDPGYVTAVGAESDTNQVVRALARIPAGDPSVSGSYPVVPVDAQGRLVANVTLIPDNVKAQATLIATTWKRQAFVVVDHNAPPKGFEVRTVWTEPQNVMLVGPRERVMKLNSVTTDKVSLEGRKGEVIQNVQVRVPEGVTVEPAVVRAHVVLQRAR